MHDFSRRFRSGLVKLFKKKLYQRRPQILYSDYTCALIGMLILATTATRAFNTTTSTTSPTTTTATITTTNTTITNTNTNTNATTTITITTTITTTATTTTSLGVWRKVLTVTP